jgi:hypothetical protein
MAGTMMFDIDNTTEATKWGILNLGIAINTALIAANLLWRARHHNGHTGARLLYGSMFLVISVFFATLAFTWLSDGDSSPTVGLFGLVMIWVTTTLAVGYLLVLRRPPHE